MIKALVIDDEKLARSLIEDYIAEVPFLECVGSFANPLHAIEALQDGKVDLIFLDIKMPKLNGLDLLAQLPNHPFVVFITAFAEHALQGYDFNTVDYLVKPVSFERFLKACFKVRKLMALPTEAVEAPLETVAIPDGGRVLHLKAHELYYVVSDGDYLELHTKTGRQQIRMSLRRLLEYALPLVRVHKSYAINPQCIQIQSSRTVTVEGVEIPIGRSFKNALSGNDK